MKLDYSGYRAFIDTGENLVCKFGRIRRECKQCVLEDRLEELREAVLWELECQDLTWWAPSLGTDTYLEFLGTWFAARQEITKLLEVDK